MGSTWYSSNNFSASFPMKWTSQFQCIESFRRSMQSVASMVACLCAYLRTYCPISWVLANIWLFRHTSFLYLTMKINISTSFNNALVYGFTIDAVTAQVVARLYYLEEMMGFRAIWSQFGISIETLPRHSTYLAKKRPSSLEAVKFHWVLPTWIKTICNS